MAGDSRLSARFGSDTSDFKAGITAINRELRVVESGFRASASALGDWGSSATGLEQRIAALNSKIELQKEKVGALTVSHERAVTAYGANSKAAQDLEISLNKETETLNSMQNELGETDQSLDDMKAGAKGAGDTTEETGKKTEEAGNKAKTSGQKFEGFKIIMDGVQATVKVGVTAVLGLSAALLGVAVGVTGLVTSSANAADKIATLSGTTGISTTRLQELGYVSAKLDVNYETLTGSFAKLTRSMASAGDQSAAYHEQVQKVAEGSGRFETAVTNAYKALSGGTTNASSKAFEALGVSIVDANGNLLSSEQIFLNTQIALKAVEGTTIGTTAASNIFGTSIKNALAFGDKLPDLGEAAGAFAQLGVATTDSSGNLRDSEAVFNDVITALSKVPNEAERDALSMQIFGKSAMEMNPLITAGTDKIAALSAEAHDAGAVMGEDTVEGLDQFSDSLAGMKLGLIGNLGTLAGSFLPGFQGMADQAGGYLKDFSTIVSGSGGDITKVGEGVGGLIGQIATDLAKQAPQMLSAGLGIIQSLIKTLITSLPTLLPVAISIIMSLVGFLTQNLPILLQAGISILLALINGIVPQLPMLIGAGLVMIMTLMQGLIDAIPQILPVIADVIPRIIDTLTIMLPDLIVMGIQLLVTLITGLAEALPEIIPAVIGIIPTIITTLLDNLPLLVGAALTLIIALATGLVTALPTLIEAIPDILQAIVDTIITLLPMIGDSALTLITTLVGGLIDNLPLIGTAVGDIITTIVDGIAALATTIWQVGSDLVAGIWQGIQDNAENFKKMVMDFFQGIIDAIKKLLGIASESTVFSGIGENMALGLGTGFMAAFAGIQNTIESAVEELGGIAGNVTVGGAGGIIATTTGGTPAAGITVNVYANVASEIDIYKLAYRIADVLQGASPR